MMGRTEDGRRRPRRVRREVLEGLVDALQHGWNHSEKARRLYAQALARYVMVRVREADGAGEVAP